VCGRGHHSSVLDCGVTDWHTGLCCDNISALSSTVLLTVVRTASDLKKTSLNCGSNAVAVVAASCFKNGSKRSPVAAMRRDFMVFTPTSRLSDSNVSFNRRAAGRTADRHVSYEHKSRVSFSRGSDKIFTFSRRDHMLGVKRFVLQAFSCCAEYRH